MVTPEIDLKSGWCQNRVDPKTSKAVVGKYCDDQQLDPEKLYTMKPICNISNTSFAPISVFDFNFIKTFIRMKRNISRYGRRWRLTIHRAFANNS